MPDTSSFFSAEDQPHYLGHRERLRQRLLDSKKGTLPDYEILEILLFAAQPRKDVKPLAKMLIQHFGSLGRALHAAQHELLAVPGMNISGVATLKATLEAVERLVKEDIKEKPLIQSWKALLDYCRVSMGHLKTEQFRILFLDKKHMLITDELQEAGTVDHTPVYPREVVKRALFLEASAIILVHNHPSGNTTPSRADIDLTKQIVAAAQPLGVLVHDHLIIGGMNHYSFKAQGII